MIEIREATKSQATEIACLIMTAMTDDCCLYFCGEGACAALAYSQPSAR